MLMPKKNRVAIYEYLFKEGVMVAKKDFHAPKHPELESIPNLQVIKAMQELKENITNEIRNITVVELTCIRQNVVTRYSVCITWKDNTSSIFYKSLKSRGYVLEQFAWRHFYWYLTNEGISYLRNYLHLPAEIVPATLKRQTRPETARPRPAAPRSEGARPAEDRAQYRRAPGAASAGPDKKADVGAGTGDLEFRGGFGRGRGGAPQ